PQHEERSVHTTEDRSDVVRDHYGAGRGAPKSSDARFYHGAQDPSAVPRRGPSPPTQTQLNRTSREQRPRRATASAMLVLVTAIPWRVILVGESPVPTGEVRRW